MYRQGTARGTETAWYQGWDLTENERATFRATTIASQQAKRQAIAGECTASKHPIYSPRLDPLDLMPRLHANGLSALSLFSGGGGMDIGFDRAGFGHVASYEIMEGAAAVLRAAHPDWTVYGGDSGDVRRVEWGKYRGKVDVLHGGPPCQPFSNAGRQNGALDVRDMIPEFVRAVKAIRPRVFVCENVSGLATKRFEEYVKSTIIEPLERQYVIRQFILNAADYGVPQTRRRVLFVGFADKEEAARFEIPAPTHRHDQSKGSGHNLPKTMGVREALGLPETGVDALSPTLRSGLTGPRHTTSVLSSVSALKLWNKLGVWPNGVAVDRAAASGYVAKNGDFRLSLPDCLVLQGFPGDWPVQRPVYFALGLIGNSVAPPMAYNLANAVAKALCPAKL
ncbi:DNA cytosine methyltransferase [Sphingomonas qomolangmaensis]|uniref:Cytosine-specific methyltransferase n=1 Tax=Sphingomonas qomolangmaensis TaxID=2918765 RepID=A0ABY5L573_9SPHN|nr:DNA (cytosine-5-)-methyltransferase [Sphingomonas qomolangmaensis]UUL82104.1 DNA (cytosine-5-)-methyltransferase [Sphingomonas qomolangmaensis]